MYFSMVEWITEFISSNYVYVTISNNQNLLYLARLAYSLFPETVFPVKLWIYLVIYFLVIQIFVLFFDWVLLGILWFQWFVRCLFCEHNVIVTFPTYYLLRQICRRFYRVFSFYLKHLICGFDIFEIFNFFWVRYFSLSVFFFFKSSTSLLLFCPYVL